MPPSHPTDLAEPAGPTLSTYLGWLRRRWWTLLVLALLGVGGGATVNALVPKQYTSTASVLVQQTDPNSSAKVNLDTEAQVVRSVVVGNRALVLMKQKATDPDPFLQAVTVAVPPNSQVLQVSFVAGTPADAQSGAHAFAQAYLDLRVAAATKNIQDQVTKLNQQIGDINKTLAAIAGKIAAAADNTIEKQQALVQRDVQTAQLRDLNAQLGPLKKATVNAGEIISDAPLPTDPSSPNTTLNLASGLGAGILFGIVLAMIMDRLDTRIRRGRDIAERLGLEVLLEVEDRVSPQSLLPSTHRVSRDLARLRNVLLTTVPSPAGGRGRQILLTDVSAGSAAGFVAGNLAAAYARTGQQVALVSTNPGSPLTAMMAGAQVRHTLADVLRRDVTPLRALVPVPGLTQLRVLLPGNLDAEDELPVTGVLEVLAELSARFEHIILEAASPLTAVETQALASHMDAVIVVCQAGRSRTGEISTMLHQFDQVDARVTGAALTPRMVSPVGTRVRPRQAGSADAVERKRIPSTPVTRQGGDERGRLVLPQQPAESTVVLPRMADNKVDGRLPGPGGGVRPTTGIPTNGTPTVGSGHGPGSATTYKSSVAGDATVALDRAEGTE